MPKTSPPNRGGSRRTATTKVAKPFPWGTAAGSLLLAVFLIGILVYAVQNTGRGISDVLTSPDTAIDGVILSDEESLSRNHVAGQVDYPQLPPNGGDHNAAPQTCAVYDAPIAPEHAVHSLEHGAVWITYNDSVSDADVEELASQVAGEDYRMMSPVPEQESPINLSAWGRRLSVDSPDDDRISDFLRGYTNGPQTPEPGASCVGVSTTGPLQAAPAGEMPSATVTTAPAPSGSAGPAASPAAPPAPSAAPSPAGE